MNAAEGARSFYKDREEREGTETDRTWSFHKKATRERGASARPQPRSGSEGSTPRNKRNNVTTRINIGENALLKRNMNRNVTFRKRNKPQEAIVSDLEFFRSPRAKKQPRYRRAGCRPSRQPGTLSGPHPSAGLRHPRPSNRE